MRGKLIDAIKDKIKNAALNDEDKKNNEKVDSVKKDLSELQSTLEKEKSILFEKEEDFNSISHSIKDSLTTLEAPKSTESNQTKQQQETQSQATTETTEPSAPQQPANTNTPSYSNNNTYSYSSNSSSSTERRRPSTPSNNTVVNEAPSNSGSTTAPAAPVAPAAPATTETPATGE